MIKERNARKKINEMVYDESCMAVRHAGFAFSPKIVKKY
jgi:hypothetical protein